MKIERQQTYSDSLRYMEARTAYLNLTGLGAVPLRQQQFDLSSCRVAYMIPGAAGLQLLIAGSKYIMSGSSLWCKGWEVHGDILIAARFKLIEK